MALLDDSNKDKNRNCYRFVGPNKRFGPDIPVEKIPAHFYCWRFVTNLIDDPNNHTCINVTGAKHIASLEHQMEYSILLLENELISQGIKVRLKLKEDNTTKISGRFIFTMDDEPIALFDKDFGFDCFDVSAETFKNKMHEVVTQALSQSVVDELLDDVFGKGKH